MFLFEKEMTGRKNEENVVGNYPRGELFAVHCRRIYRLVLQNYIPRRALYVH